MVLKTHLSAPQISPCSVNKYWTWYCQDSLQYYFIRLHTASLPKINWQLSIDFVRLLSAPCNELHLTTLLCTSLSELALANKMRRDKDFDSLWNSSYAPEEEISPFPAAAYCSTEVSHLVTGCALIMNNKQKYQTKITWIMRYICVQICCLYSNMNIK